MEIEQSLRMRGLSADFPEPASAAEARLLLESAVADGYALVVVAGGDGSVRLAVNALAERSIPLGIVPLGTGNLLAATLGIPRQPVVAATRLASARPATIDSGLLTADDMREYFAVAAGLGFDARVMAATGSVAKARFGVLAYFATLVRLLPSLPAARAQIGVDGIFYELSAVAVLIANCGEIVPGMLGPRVRLDPRDGLLDVIAVKGAPLPLGLPIAARSALHSLFRGDAASNGYSLRVRGHEVSVRTEPPEPMEVDGDLLDVPIGTFHASVRPRSLTVLV